MHKRDKLSRHVFSMLFILLSVSCLLFFACPAYAQWAATYGGVGFEEARSVQQTTDGGFVVAGETESFGAGGTDVWVLKLNSSGNIQWQKSYGGDSFDGASSIQQTTGGGYIVAGLTFSPVVGHLDFWVLKLDSNGNVQWQKGYNGGADEEAYSIQQTMNGGYIVAGRTTSFIGPAAPDFWVLKLKPDGTINPACRFFGDTNASVVDTDALPIDTNVSPNDTGVTPQSTEAEVLVTHVSAIICRVPEACTNGIDDNGDGLVDCIDPDCVGDPACCDSTSYSRGRSFVRFTHRTTSRDRAFLQMCVNQPLCDALKAGVEEIVLKLDDCNSITIPGSELKSNRSKTLFIATSSTHRLKINCIKGWLMFSLKKADLKDCISNPIKTCISITNGACLCAEDEFVERLDRKGRLVKLFLKVKGSCLP